MTNDAFAPGARVIIRDEEWLIRRVDRTSSGSDALSVVGLSPLVQGQEKIFISTLESKIEVVDPVISYYPPFDKCDREADYRTAWEHFDKLEVKGE